MVTSVCSVVLKTANTIYSFNISYFNDYSRVYQKYHRGKHILDRKISLKEICTFIDLPFKPNSAEEL